MLWARPVTQNKLTSLNRLNNHHAILKTYWLCYKPDKRKSFLAYC